MPDRCLPQLHASAAGVLALVTIACATGCGDGVDTPSSPSGAAGSSSGLSVEPGAYVLVASASMTPVVDGQTVSLEGCTGTGTFAGVSVLSFVTLGRDGAAWVARSTTPEDGSVELRLVTAQSSFGPVLMAGTAHGTAVDRRAAGNLGLASMTFSGAGGPAANLSGSFTAATSSFTGTGEGVLAVRSPIGDGSCTRGLWTIRKPAPCELANSC
jgi:hypothetical protein